MQRETIRLEREMKDKFETESKTLRELFRVENEGIESRVKAVLADTARLIVERDNFSHQLENLNRELAAKRKEQDILKQTIDDRRETLKALKGRLKSKEQAREEERHAQEESLRVSIKRAERDCDTLRSEIQRDLKSNAEALLKLKNEHDDELRRMDASVKTEIVHKDKEIESLKETLLIEDAKRTKLEKLIAQYYKTSTRQSRK